MGFQLTQQQKLGLKGLGFLAEDRFEELVDVLECRMSEAYMREAGSVTSPLLEARVKFIEVQKASEKLSKALKSLSENDQYRIKSLIGIHYHENQAESAKSTKRRDLDIQKILALLEKAAADLVEDSRTSYGSRANDKAVLWLLEYWEEYVKLPIGKFNEKGDFVCFTAIILEKDPETVRKLVTRFLRRQSKP